MNSIKSKQVITFIFLLYTLSSISCSEVADKKITVANPNEFALTDAFIILNVDNDLNSISIFDNGKEIPFQIISSGENNSIGLVLDFESGETKTLSIKEIKSAPLKKFNTRTYAEISMKPGNVYFDGNFRGDKFVNVSSLKVPSIHTDHDALFKYEGPGWESEKVG
ncbi:MAG TPA: DUF4861 family protein, partial [Ignavibacteriaceae bacterium]